MPDTLRREAERDEFAELVWADADWVRAEFDAIVAASYPSLPPCRRVPPCPGQPSPMEWDGASRASWTAGRAVGEALPAFGWRRQRAPPGDAALRPPRKLKLESREQES